MSLIRGEYWIDDSGNTTYADGDVGDQGHEAIAFETALGLNGEEMPRGCYIGSLNETIIAEDYLKEKGGKFDLNELSDMDEKNQIKVLKKLGVEKQYLEFEPETALAYQWYSDKGANMKFVGWCSGSHCDAREYALENMGWIRVKRDDFETWKFDDDALKLIQGFDEWPEEDDDGYGIEESNAEVGISERLTGWYENIPVKVLLKAKSADGLKNYASGIGKFHRDADNPIKRKRARR